MTALSIAEAALTDEKSAGNPRILNGDEVLVGDDLISFAVRRKVR